MPRATIASAILPVASTAHPQFRTTGAIFNREYNVTAIRTLDEVLQYEERFMGRAPELPVPRGMTAINVLVKGSAIEIEGCRRCLLSNPGTARGTIRHRDVYLKRIVLMIEWPTPG
jgi:hypothetical protein